MLTFSTDAINAITTYSWPGNVRDLENAIQRSVILCEDNKKIDRKLLAIDQNLSDVDSQSSLDENMQQIRGYPSHTPFSKNDNGDQQELSLDDYFHHFVVENQDTMNETELARTLGVSRKCLWERRQKLGIPRKKTNKR